MRQGTRAFFPDHRFGFMLGAKVGMVEAFSLFEHVLPEHTVVHTSRCNRTRQVKSPCFDCLCELHRCAGPLDVDLLLHLGTRVQVINGSQMKDVIDLSFQRLGLRRAHAQAFFRQVAFHLDEAVVADSILFAQCSDLPGARLADQQVDRATTLQQPGHQTLANKPGATGNEIIHSRLPTQFLVTRAEGPGRCC